MPKNIGPNEPGLDESLITSLFPGEVVTRALVRDVELPYGAGTMALITLDNGHDHTKPNTFGPAGLVSLRDALDAVAARATPEAGEQRIAAVGVTGKPFIFAVGADLTGAALIRSRDEALTIARLGHQVFRRFGELGVPSFAFVNGAALGNSSSAPTAASSRRRLRRSSTSRTGSARWPGGQCASKLASGRLSSPSSTAANASGSPTTWLSSRSASRLAGSRGCSTPRCAAGSPAGSQGPSSNGGSSSTFRSLA